MTVLIMVLELVFCSKAQAGECHQAQYTGDRAVAGEERIQISSHALTTVSLRGS